MGDIYFSIFCGLEYCSFERERFAVQKVTDNYKEKKMHETVIYTCTMLRIKIVIMAKWPNFNDYYI